MTKIQKSPNYTHSSNSSLPFPMELDRPSVSADPTIAKRDLPRVPFNSSSSSFLWPPFPFLKAPDHRSSVQRH